MHLVKSYASDRVRHMRADFYNFKIYENLPPDDVSVHQMIIKNAISLCWRTMLQCSDIHVIQNMVRSTLLQVAGGRQTAQVPKCELLIFALFLVTLGQILNP